MISNCRSLTRPFLFVYVSFFIWPFVFTGNCTKLQSVCVCMSVCVGGVQKSTCSTPTESGQQSSTRGVDFILVLIMFRVTLHRWKGLGHTFIQCSCHKSWCSQRILNVSSTFNWFLIMFFDNFHKNNRIFLSHSW